jgi:hypothetical protein
VRPYTRETLLRYDLDEDEEETEEEVETEDWDAEESDVSDSGVVSLSSFKETIEGHEDDEDDD